MEKKEMEEFLIRFGGAMAGGLEDAAFECAWKAGLIVGFPCTSIHEKLAPADDLIVGGLSIPPWVIGALMEEDGKKRGDVKAKELGKNLKMFGEGNVCYSIPMVIHHSLIRMFPKTWVTEARVRSARSRSPPSGGSRRPPGTVVKL